MSWLLLFALSLTSTYPPGQDPFPFPPAQSELYDRVFALNGKQDFAAALPLAEQLTKTVPDNPRGWRALGWTYFGLKRFVDADRAFTRALDLGIDDKRKPDTLGSRARVRMELRQEREAEADADAALALDPHAPQAREARGILAARRNDLATAQHDFEDIIVTLPKEPQGHFLLAEVLADQKENERALAEIATTRALGGHGPSLDAMESELRGIDRAALWWEIPLGSALFLGLGLLGFFVVGSLLSRAEIGRLAAVDVHLLRNEQKRGEWIVERLYGLVLWSGTLLFYVSVPLTIMLTLVVGAGLLYLLFQLPRIPVQLIVIAFLAAFGGAWSIIRGLFLRRQAEEPGWRLRAEEHPRLFGALREASEVARSRMVDRVQLETDASVGVREAGGTLRVLFGRGERVLHLGFGALRGLTVSELKSILTHEYGHFAHGETRLNPVVGRIMGTLVAILQRMGRLGWSAAVNPVYWYLRWYFKVYVSVSRGQARRRELLADRAAAIGYGGDTFARELTEVVANDELFDRLAAELALLLRESGRPCHNVYRYLDAAAQATPAELRAKRLAERIDHEASAFDSHPPPKDRIQRVSGIPAARPNEPEAAWSLFEDAEAVQRKLSAKIVERIDAYMDQQSIRRAATRPTEPSEEAALAALLASHQDALAVAVSDGAAGEPLVEQSLARLRANLGANDRCFLRALTKVSHVRKHRGDGPGARAALEQALTLAEASPEADARDVEELRALLARIAA